MNLAKIHEIAYKTMGKRKSHLQREKGFVYYHGQRVAKLALNLRKEMFPDDSSLDEIISIGAQFHDVAKGIEPHHKTGAVLIRTLLEKECSQDELEKISEIIEYHNDRNNYEHPFYVKIVQDADVLDHFGSLEIWLKFMYSAHTDEDVFASVKLWGSEEYLSYLEKSRASLNYELSKEIFDCKSNFHKEFQQRFISEINGEINFE